MTAADDRAREEIAAALRDAAHWCECTEDEPCPTTILATAMTRGVPSLIEGSPEDLADAVRTALTATHTEENR